MACWDSCAAKIVFLNEIGEGEGGRRMRVENEISINIFITC